MMTVMIDDPRIESRFNHSPQKVIETLRAFMNKQDEIATQIEEIKSGKQTTAPLQSTLDQLKEKYRGR